MYVYQGPVNKPHVNPHGGHFYMLVYYMCHLGSLLHACILHVSFAFFQSGISFDLLSVFNNKQHRSQDLQLKFVHKASITSFIKCCTVVNFTV